MLIKFSIVSIIFCESVLGILKLNFSSIEFIKLGKSLKFTTSLVFEKLIKQTLLTILISNSLFKIVVFKYKYNPLLFWIT